MVTEQQMSVFYYKSFKFIDLPYFIHAITLLKVLATLIPLTQIQNESFSSTDIRQSFITKVDITHAESRKRS